MGSLRYEFFDKLKLNLNDVIYFYGDLMKFIFSIVLICMFNNVFCSDFEEGLQGKKPFCIMTIVRDAQSVMLPSERRCIENVIKLLCKDEIEEEDKSLPALVEKDNSYIRDIKEKDVEMHMTNENPEYILSIYNKNMILTKEFYNILKKSLLVYITNNIEKIKFFRKENGIIVLNEMFFGKEAPYIPEEYESVQREFLELSKTIPNKLFCINILANKKHSMSRSKIEQVKALESKRFVRNDTKFDSQSTSSSGKTLKDQYIEEAYKEGEKIALENASHAFLAGKLVFTYNKGTYFGECDDQLDRNIPYIFGDGQVHFFPDFRSLEKYISVQICRDLACGVGIPIDSKSIHIFQSNSLGIYQGPLSKKVKTLVHADPKFSVQSGDFYCNRMIFNLDEEDSMWLRWENGGNLIFSLKFCLNNTWYYIFVREVSNDLS